MRIAKMPFYKYMPISKIGFLTMMTYRWECVFATLSSLVMVFFTYYLWQAVYANSTMIDANHTFAMTFTYVAISIAILVTFNTSAENNVSRSIISGDIIREIVRPLSYHYTQIAAALGVIFLRGVLIFIPCLVVTILLLPGNTFSLSNMLLFSISLIPSFIILFHIDMLAGLIAVRTEAVWGIRLAKDYIVLIFSGAVIPLYMLPDTAAKALMYLPFQGICHTPMTILTTRDISVSQIVNLIGIQILWSIILIIGVGSGLKILIKKIEVSGG
jgi:ABC-2 type transport system permease protein